MTALLAPAITDATRREFLAVLGLAGLLTACGERSEPGTAATRPVATAYGTVEVPTDPQRVVATYTDNLDVAVALELNLVAAPGARGVSRNTFPPFLPAERLRDVQRLDTYPEMAIEPVAAARPDLILNGFPDQHEQLAALAPTVTIETADTPWPDVVALLAPALGKEDLAARPGTSPTCGCPTAGRRTGS